MSRGMYCVIIAAVLRRSLQLGINPTLGTSVRHGLGGSAANTDIDVLKLPMPSVGRDEEGRRLDTRWQCSYSSVVVNSFKLNGRSDAAALTKTPVRHSFRVPAACQTTVASDLFLHPKAVYWLSDVNKECLYQTNATKITRRLNSLSSADLPPSSTTTTTVANHFHRR
jgi:hypothetical protein